MIPFFDFQLYEHIRKNNLAEWNNASKFPGEALLMAESIYEKNTGWVHASAELLALASIMDDVMDRELAVSSSQLLQCLPVGATLDDVSEMTLITHYILPALQPLFDDDEKSTRLEFTSTNPANIDERSPNFNGCPDFTITVFPPQTSGGVNVGYGEVKRFSMVGNHYLVNWDLVRLALFGKRAMDRNSLASALSVHIVAPYMTFYAIQLKADGLYTMTKLARVQFPISILELPAYITSFSRLKKVLKTFSSMCSLMQVNDICLS